MATDREKLPNASPTIARIRSSVAVLSDFSQSIASADKTKADDHSQDTTGRYKSHNKIRVLYYFMSKIKCAYCRQILPYAYYAYLNIGNKMRIIRMRSNLGSSSCASSPSPVDSPE